MGGIAISDTRDVVKGAKSIDETAATGIGHWMQVTLERSAEARPELSEKAVHDLRVAIRRCRSMAEEYAQLDPHPGWRQIRNVGRRLFRDLGGLRDLQVMELWLAELAPEDDPVRRRLEGLLQERQSDEKRRARKALDRFDVKKWRKLGRRLTPRAERFPVGGPAFLHQALLRWEAAYKLHRLAMRDRSKVSFHRLRIGLKRFRYTIENFLPEMHRKWQSDLKELQDHLGEIHDLDVLWSFLPQAGALFDRVARQIWRKRVLGARQLRLTAYRRRMLGPKSRWVLWRADLPSGESLEEAGLAKLTAWATDPSPRKPHGHRVEEIAVRVHDLIGEELTTPPFDRPRWRTVLRACARLENAYRSTSFREGPKQVARRLLKSDPPVMWSRQDLEATALVIHCSRTADPDKLQARLKGKTARWRRAILVLSAQLRFAKTLEKRGLKPTDLTSVQLREGTITLRLHPTDRPDRLYLALGSRKNVLEWALGTPIILDLGRNPPEGGAAAPSIDSSG